MPKPGIDLRATAGMSFSAECRWHFWLGWLSLTLGIWSATYASFLICPRLPSAFYLANCYVAFLGPFLALAYADLRSVAIYYQTYTGLSHRNLAQLVLDPQTLERIRRELRLNPLLRWATPLRGLGVREQLLSASQWWPAQTRSQDSAWLARYGEWLAATLFGYLPLATSAQLSVIALFFAGDMTRWMLAMITGLGGLGWLVIGQSSIRLAGRRQAILDFFRTWLVPRDAIAAG